MVNPVDAHRKQLRKKEVKKNKNDRKSAREVATVKKDTRTIEADIRKLSAQGNLSQSDKSELAQLKSELAYVQKSKADYVEAHPEHRKIVYPDAKPTGNALASGSGEQDDGTGLYGKDGRLRNPELSVYYDAVFNPYGAPPPGMPYRAKQEIIAHQPIAFLPQVVAQTNQDSEDEDDDEDDIEMPAGPPPDSDDSDDDSDDDDDDDIAMPAGPPPAKPAPPNSSRVTIDRPRSAPQPPQQVYHHPQPLHYNPHMRAGHFAPRQPNQFERQQQQQFHSLPPPPGAPTGPRHMQTIIDPLASGLPPKPTFQAIHADQSRMSSAPLPPPGPADPPPPITGLPSTMKQIPGATYAAAPQLRDLKAEAVAFVPTIIKRKKAVVIGAGTLSAINAAPEQERAEGEDKVERVSLLSALKSNGVVAETVLPSRNKGKEDYDRFLNDMGDLL